VSAKRKRSRHSEATAEFCCFFGEKSFKHFIAIPFFLNTLREAEFEEPVEGGRTYFLEIRKLPFN